MKAKPWHWSCELNRLYLCSFYFNVLDVPGPPQGPIEYEEVTGNSVTISWRKPLDNGGSEITGYVIEKKDLDHAGKSQYHLTKFM